MAAHALAPAAGETRRRSRLARSVAGLGVAPLLVATDVASLMAAVLISGSVRALVLVPVVPLMYLSTPLYRPRLDYSILDHLPALVGRVLLVGAVVAAVDAWAWSRQDRKLLPATLIAAALIVVTRWAAYSAVRHLRRARVIAHRTLIVGGGQVSGELASILLEHGEYGMLPVGFIDDDPLLPPEARPVPLLGGHEDLVDVLREVDASNVVVAFGSMSESQVVDMIRTCDRLSCEIFSIPRLYELQAVEGDMDLAWGIPLMRLRRAAYRTRTWKLKRALDIVGAATGLLLLSPLLAVCALGVRLETGAKVLFRQNRVGIDGRVITILKFRTLMPDGSDSQTRWSIAGDPHVRWFGRILRKTSLDELPQLWNVLTGDMSLVGPRPERPFFVTEFTERFPRYVSRHRVPAGITGWAQIHGLRGDTSIADRARFDNYYIESWSLWGDSKIMLRTLGHVFRARGT